MNSVKPTAATSPADYIKQIDQPRRGEIVKLDKFIRKTVPALERFIYGSTTPMLGYGPHHFKYPSGREGDAAIVTLASQKNYISLYVMCDQGVLQRFLAVNADDSLGKVNLGKGCIRFKRVEDVNLDALATVLAEAARTQAKTPDTAQ